MLMLEINTQFGAAFVNPENVSGIVPTARGTIVERVDGDDIISTESSVVLATRRQAALEEIEDFRADGNSIYDETRAAMLCTDNPEDTTILRPTGQVPLFGNSGLDKDGLS